MSKQGKKTSEEQPFEAVLAELEEVVEKLEGGHTPLEESIVLYERGVALKKQCETKLHDVKLRIEKITQDESGAAATEPFSEA